MPEQDRCFSLHLCSALEAKQVKSVIQRASGRCWGVCGSVVPALPVPAQTFGNLFELALCRLPGLGDLSLSRLSVQ